MVYSLVKYHDETPLDNEIYLKMKNKTEKQFLLGDGTSGKGE
jgi:hypothetical protein